MCSALLVVYIASSLDAHYVGKRETTLHMPQMGKSKEFSYEKYFYSFEKNTAKAATKQLQYVIQGVNGE